MFECDRSNASISRSSVVIGRNFDQDSEYLEINGDNDVASTATAPVNRRKALTRPTTAPPPPPPPPPPPTAGNFIGGEHGESSLANVQHRPLPQPPPGPERLEPAGVGVGGVGAKLPKEANFVTMCYEKTRDKDILKQISSKTNIENLLAARGISSKDVLQQVENESVVHANNLLVALSGSVNFTSLKDAVKRLKRHISTIFFQESVATSFQAFVIDRDAVLDRIVAEILENLKPLMTATSWATEETNGGIKKRCRFDSLGFGFDCGSKNYDQKKFEYLSIFTEREAKIWFRQSKISGQPKWKDEIVLDCRMHLQAVEMNVTELAGLQRNQAEEVFGAVEWTGQCMKLSNQKDTNSQKSTVEKFLLFAARTSNLYSQT